MKRHQHRHSPRIQTASPGIGHYENGRAIRHSSLATGSHTYHPTKGWRRDRRDLRAGYAIIESFLSRAFA